MTCAAECGRERDHRNEDQLALISSSLNAAPEWQAESLGWRSRGLLEAYSIEDLFVDITQLLVNPSTSTF